jgi:nucleoside-triphosphatase
MGLNPHGEKILLTGRPGIGKTTVVLKVASLLKSVAGGFYTEEIREAGRRLGFRVRDVRTGKEGILSQVNFPGPHRVGKYGVDVASFERIGVAALKEALGRKGCILVDEIGKMELCSARFQEAMKLAMDSPNPFLATIPLFSHPFLDGLKNRPDATLIHVTSANRDALPKDLAVRLSAPDRGTMP